MGSLDSFGNYYFESGIGMEIYHEEKNEGDMDIDHEERSGGSTEIKENGLHLYPVSVNEAGEGLPYAPIDWPCPGDTWSWKVGKRTSVGGYFLDRYLYLPKRLQSLPKGRGFASRLSVEQYVRTFPDANVKAFFASFSWKIPSRSLSKVKGIGKVLAELSLPYGKKMEHPGSEEQPGVSCKAGNKLCSSLIESEEPPSKVMFCDICCSEPRFCRDCCCILCCRSVDSAYGGYSFIRCEAAGDDGFICGHIAHFDCSIRSYMAGSVGGSINLDAEYYCRRCDARTDLLAHVTKLFQTCESVNSRDDVEKILNLGVRILHGSHRTIVKRLLQNMELASGKLKSGTPLEDVWKVHGSSAVIPGVVSDKENIAMDCVEPADIQPGSPHKVSTDFDFEMESRKLDDEIEQSLEELRKSQELEYNIARETLDKQKGYIHNLYQHLALVNKEIARHTAYVADQEALLQPIKDRTDQIKREVMKLKNLREVVKGFAQTSKEILKEQFGVAEIRKCDSS